MEPCTVYTPTNISSDSQTSSDSGITKQVLDIFQTYVVLPICILGLFGNLISVVIFSRTWRKDSATSHYCLALAVTDSGMVILVGLKNWLSQGLSYLTDGQVHVDPLVGSLAVCKTWRYVEQTCMFLSSWIIVLFSGERCYAVSRPLQRSLITTKRRLATIAVLVGSAFIFKIYVPYFFTIFSLGPDKSDNCWYPPEMQTCTKMMFLMIDIFTNIGIPCILIFALNIAISFRIVRSTQNVTNSSLSRVLAQRQRRETKVIVNLVCISMFFCICTMPTVVMWSLVDTLEYIQGDHEKSMKLFPAALLTDSITIINYSMNWVIYGISLDFYREELKKIFRGCHGSARDEVDNLDQTMAYNSNTSITYIGRGPHVGDQTPTVSADLTSYDFRD